MGQIDQLFFPPRYWQQFEDLTLGCFREIIGDDYASKNGRNGSPQAGVDVYGKTRDGFTGIQCKQVDPIGPNGKLLPGGRVTKAVLEAEIAKAETFQPSLDVFVLATTATASAKLQETARLLSAEREASGKFRVVLWFWDDYVAFLNTSHRLQKWFYENVLQLVTRADEDQEILRFFAEAFHRPAFEHPLSVEDFDAFPQALEDTQTALRTGHLYDRRSRSLIRQGLSWRRLSDRRWRDGLARVDKVLAALRVELAQSEVAGLIVRRGAFMEIRDHRVRDELDRLRRACVDELNAVLCEARIDPV